VTAGTVDEDGVLFNPFDNATVVVSVTTP